MMRGRAPSVPTGGITGSPRHVERMERFVTALSEVKPRDSEPATRGADLRAV